MKSEKEIIEQLSEYEWFYDFIVETWLYKSFKMGIRSWF